MQTWQRGNRHLNAKQIRELRDSELKKQPVTALEKDPELSTQPDVPSTQENATQEHTEPIEELDVEVEFEEDEFIRLKGEKAWLKPELKARYSELKKRLNK